MSVTETPGGGVVSSVRRSACWRGPAGTPGELPHAEHGRRATDAWAPSHGLMSCPGSAELGSFSDLNHVIKLYNLKFKNGISHHIASCCSF